jgi:hypothetical protein
VAQSSNSCVHSGYFISNTVLFMNFAQKECLAHRDLGSSLGIMSVIVPSRMSVEEGNGNTPNSSNEASTQDHPGEKNLGSE